MSATLYCGPDADDDFEILFVDLQLHTIIAIAKVVTIKYFDDFIIFKIIDLC